MSNIDSNTEDIRLVYTLINECRITFHELEEVYVVAKYLANLYPEPTKVMVGIIELLLNALEHGNLGISYEQKTLLQREHKWEQEIKALSKLPENKNKCVKVHFVRTDVSIILRIQDHGNGFNWKKYCLLSDELAEELADELELEKHGRGISIAKTLSFDSIEYIRNGNEVICITSLSS